MSNIVLPDVVARIKNAISKEIRTNQPLSNWASRVGHPCERFLVYTRTEWEKVPPITVEKKMLFDLGHVFERHVAKVYLEKAGFEIVEMDRPIQTETSGLLKRIKLHGKIDFIARDPKDGFEFPVEAKSCSPHSWEAVDAIDDLLQSKYIWMRQYPAQLGVYILSKNYEIGLFLLINKVTGEPKALWMHQDYSYAEGIIQKVERVNAAIDAGTLPERIGYEDAICGRCDFATICLDGVARTEAEVMTDPDLIDSLAEREVLKVAHKRYEEVDSEIKARIKREAPDMVKAIAGDFLIQQKTSERAGYQVNPSIVKTISIKKLG